MRHAEPFQNVSNSPDAYFVPISLDNAHTIQTEAARWH